jgi:hypothetical protein
MFETQQPELLITVYVLLPSLSSGMACLNQPAAHRVCYAACGNICKLCLYSIAPVCVGNTFKDLPQLHETADNPGRCIKRDIRLTYLNTVKFN